MVINYSIPFTLSHLSRKARTDGTEILLLALSLSYICRVFFIFQGLRNLFFEKYRSNDGYMISSRLPPDGLNGYMGILFFRFRFWYFFFILVVISSVSYRWCGIFWQKVLHVCIYILGCRKGISRRHSGNVALEHYMGTSQGWDGNFGIFYD